MAPQIIEPEVSIGGQTFRRSANSVASDTYSEYQKYKEALQSSIDREAENLTFYTGLDDSHWTADAKAQLDAEKRPTITLNLAGQKIDGIAGSITRNPFDTKYFSDDARYDHLTYALQQKYLDDKERMDWQTEFDIAVKYGLLHSCCMQMLVETDPPAEITGNIAIRCRQPLSTIPDPNWKSISNKKLESAFCTGYFTRKEMIYQFPDAADKIESEMNFKNLFSETFENNDPVDYNKDGDTSRGSSHLVVEKHYLEHEKIIREYDPGTGIIFWEWMSDEQKTNIALKNDIPSERIKKINVPFRRLKIVTMCPDYPGMVLSEGDAVLQTGMMDLFFWSALFVNGTRIGMIDFLKDAQRHFNYRLSTITHAASAAASAGIGIDEGLFGNDQTLIDEFIKDYGNPRQVARFKSGASRMFPNGIIPLARTTIAPELFSIANQMMDLMNVLVPQPVAGEARTERSGESGIHYAQKLEVMKTLQTPLMAGIRQLWNDIGEAYLYAAPQIYCHGIRKFKTRTGEEIVLNRPSVDPATGVFIVENDFSEIAAIRHKIQITESPSGINNRIKQQELNQGLLSTWSPAYPNTGLSFAENILKTMEFTDEEKESAAKGIALDRALIESTTKANIAMNESKYQAAQQIQQQQQMPGQPGQQGQMAAPIGESGAVPPPTPENVPVEPPVNPEAQMPETIAAPEPAIANPPEDYSRTVK